MKSRHLSKSFIGALLTIFFFLQIQVQMGCAVIIPPTGGPRDTVPPILLNESPRDSSLNFRGNRIVFTFDEFVELQDVTKNLLFMPSVGKDPAVNYKLRTVTVHLPDLQPNTTYTLNLGDAIRDIDEANVIHNFHYTFSTGPVMDTMQYSGKIFSAETGTVDTTMQVLLYKDRTDSAVSKKDPLYISKVDKNGNFSFHNLPRDTFAIYGVEVNGTFRRYMNKSNLFAFANEPVIIGQSNPDTLYAYREQPKKNIAQSSGAVNLKSAPNEKQRLRFTNNIQGGQQDLLEDLILTFTTPLRTLDTGKIQVTTDSTYTAVPFTAKLDTSKTLLTIASPWKENKPYNIVLQKDFATDTLGRQLLRADTIHFTSKRVSDYGSINIRVRNVDPSKNPVLQFVQNDKVIYSVSVKSGIFNARLFLPGDYDLRILYDQNNNLKWDPGQFFGQKRQPELVKPLNHKISVKAAWDNQFDVTL
jgi:hypothetical protein